MASMESVREEDDEIPGDYQDVCTSSESLLPHQVRWIFCNCNFDPFISTRDDNADSVQYKSSLLYAEGNMDSTPFSKNGFNPPESGSFVYIRNAGNLDQRGCSYV